MSPRATLTPTSEIPVDRVVFEVDANDFKQKMFSKYILDRVARGCMSLSISDSVTWINEEEYVRYKQFDPAAFIQPQVVVIELDYAYEPQARPSAHAF